MLDTTVRFLIDPFNILWLLGIVLVVLWLTNKKQWLIRMSVVTIVWFLITSTPLVPIMLLDSLDSRYRPLRADQLPDSSNITHILVLGGGHGFDRSLPANSQLSEMALSRLSEGIRLHRMMPDSRLILSGSTSNPRRTTQAEMLQRSAILLGVDAESTLIQSEPSTTREEARVYAERFGNSHPLIVVTSAAHMPRAILLFRQQGIEAIPSPAHFRLKGSWRRKRFGLPSMKNMEFLKIAFSEYAAITREKIRGPEDNLVIGNDE